jgi:Ni/Fe-hydrogenase subunit HybB-like protein
MLEKALSGSRLYWTWMFLLALVAVTGAACYLVQVRDGLMVTGMGRDVSWGLYIGQFTFFVGVAASAVTVVLPYYLHDHRVFGPITILGEFLAIASVIMCLAFIFVDMGQPFRILNVFLYPSPASPMFWDTVALSGYLLLNLVIGWAALGAEQKRVTPPRWVKPLIYVSIPWAVSIHTVTAFIYAGLPDRHLWLSAITAVRFLASAFASGPALLLLLCAVVERFTSFRPGREPRAALSVIIAYAFSAHLFFLALEFFTAYYSGIPAYRHSLDYLFFGAEGNAGLMPLMALSVLCAVVAFILLLVPRLRKSDRTMMAAAALVFASIMLEKGIGFVPAGFNPAPTGALASYAPTLMEAAIAAGIWAIGLIVLTALFKITVAVREEAR